MAKTHKSLLKTFLSAAAGCGCGRPKTSDAYEPMPKPKAVKTNGVGKEEDDGVNVKSSTVNADTSASSCTGSSCPDVTCQKIGDSVAVEFESDDPYRDFRESMVEMISEKEIESRDELEELLNCFLQINSPRHHDVIVRAFTDVWDHRDASGRVESG